MNEQTMKRIWECICCGERVRAEKSPMECTCGRKGRMRLVQDKPDVFYGEPQPQNFMEIRDCIEANSVNMRIWKFLNYDPNRGYIFGKRAKPLEE